MFLAIQNPAISNLNSVMVNREWRQGGRAQTSLVGGVQPGMDPVPSPTVSASRKRQKTGSQPMASLSSVPPSMATPPAAALHPQPPQPPPPVAVPMQPSTSSVAKKGVPPPFSKGKKAKPVCCRDCCSLVKYGFELVWL